MQTSASLKYATISPQKARLVINQIRGLTIEKALDILTFSTKKAATLVKKIVESAVANAENNHGLDIDTLYISETFVDEAPRRKGFSARAKGRGNRIIKRNSHITITVATKEA